MCGISGIISKANLSVDQHQLKSISDIMQHRGPDSQGFFTHQNVGLAHNRLSLLDLSSNGNQPFKNDTHALIFNGEIYNWKELRSELEYGGTKFNTNSDTEVLFLALQIWGLEYTLKQLKGMFAFAWYNIQENQLFLVRDRLGIKPLF
jgi:asparagine synthase (glutamine-hydrolysing)